MPQPINELLQTLMEQQGKKPAVDRKSNSRSYVDGDAPNCASNMVDMGPTRVAS